MCVYAGSGNIEVSSKSEQGVKSLGDVPWRRFLNNKALWGLVAVHCSFGVGPLVCLSWLPSYYSDVSYLALRPPPPPTPFTLLPFPPNFSPQPSLSFSSSLSSSPPLAPPKPSPACSF